MTKKKNYGKAKLLFVILGLAAAIFAVLALFVIGIYKFNWNNRFFVAISSRVPFPAAYVHNAGIISVNEIKSDNAAVKKFYESQDFEKLGMRVDFSTEQGKKRLQVKEKNIISKLVENKVIEDLAKKRGISITDAAVSSELEKNIAQFGNKDNLMSDLARLYGWTIDDFEQKIVKPEMYSRKLEEIYSKELDSSQQKAKADSLYEKVTKGKVDFASVAKENSDGQSAENGGDLGWSTKDQLIQAVAEKAFSMKAGDISQPVESSLGFHILKLQEKKTDNGQELVHLSQIFVKKDPYSDWLASQMKNYSVTIFLGAYTWNEDTGQIEFSDPAMNTFEKNLSTNSEGDPSVF
jgi:hypothetical protein